MKRGIRRDASADLQYCESLSLATFEPKNVLITEIFAFKSIAYLKADPGQFLTYPTITSILGMVKGNGQARPGRYALSSCGLLYCGSVETLEHIYSKVIVIKQKWHMCMPEPHHMLQTEEEVLDIVEDDPSTILEKLHVR
ncbi:hypothetical protein NQ317_012328 [Molorchus minor]|uniref:Uncharacterized protein n=1 Tax=Molorchus minor TaxID=1323400 RepID=A0ABQ9ISB1_9CUCU|nr:hypothetical protein NQ317_012328 [Molorchus minor]